jgi:hypothetical protein
VFARVSVNLPSIWGFSPDPKTIKGVSSAFDTAIDMGKLDVQAKRELEIAGDFAFLAEMSGDLSAAAISAGDTDPYQRRRCLCLE